MPNEATTESVDAFILFNEQENQVEKIVEMLSERRVFTYFWRRDIAIGESWAGIETRQLELAKTVVIFLGNAGWGPTQREIGKSAIKLNKPIIPVLIGDPPPESFEDVSGLFNQLRYLDMRVLSGDNVDRLAREIRRRADDGGASFNEAREEKDNRKIAQVERIIRVLVDGNEQERAWALRQVQTSPQLDKRLLGTLLRDEIQGRFSSQAEHNFESASRDPKKISSIRSWMLSCLIWANGQDRESRELVIGHLTEAIENDRNVRFWILAGLYQTKSIDLKEALTVVQEDTAQEVTLLRLAIISPDNADVIERLQDRIESLDFRNVWPVLRVLRIVAVPQLIPIVCRLFVTSPTDSAIAYDSCYALSNPEMAAPAAKILAESPGLEQIVKLVIAIASLSNETARRSFCLLLAQFDTQKLNELLKHAEADPEIRSTVSALRFELSQIIKSDRTDVFIAGYASDTIDIRNDRLEIKEDVTTLVAIILAKNVKPPLAVGLFGDWGTGKSFFMQSMMAEAEKLSARSKAPDAKFCSNIVQIEFNAWHYIDANLWASLVSHILERLAKYVSPEITEEEREAVLLKELSTAKTIVAEAEAEKENAQKVIDDRQTVLQDLQLQREQAEIKLSDLRAADLANLLVQNEDLKHELETALNKIGTPVALEKFSELNGIVADAHSLRGRAIALFLSVLNGKNKYPITVLVLIMVVGSPLLVWMLHKYIFTTSDVLVAAATIVTQLTALIAGATVVLRRGLTVVNGALTQIERAKQQVDKLLAERRQNPSEEEKQLQTEIANLKAKEKEVSARVAAAAARVVELEAQIRAINEGRSLARFLGERVNSEDYRKHLGLISTIRRDFESLATRLESARKKPESGFRAAERIILYIDDLDRCPENKVMEVLQAVHLLLAYPLFVVVVGVDPRWLLHSLSTTYGAFQNGFNIDTPDVWRTTPQNYLEKIFQIPFSLRPMTDTGYSRLVSKLLCNDVADPTQIPVTDIRKETESSQPDAKSEINGDQQSDRNTEIDGTVENQTRTTPDVANQRRRNGEQKIEFEIQDDALIINEWEANFAVRLYSLIPSPRAAKRFSNIYRILKAHVRRENLRQFEGTDELPGDFQIPMLLLAMLIGSPDECALLFPNLQKWAAQKKDVLEQLQNLNDASRLKESGLEPVAAAALAAKLEPIINDSSFPGSADVFLEWLPRVSRFSFEIGRVVQPLGTATAQSLF